MTSNVNGKSTLNEGMLKIVSHEVENDSYEYVNEEQQRADENRYYEYAGKSIFNFKSLLLPPL